MPGREPRARDRELDPLQATLAGRALERYRRVVGSSKVLTSAHAVLAWPARKLILGGAPRGGVGELPSGQATLGWRFLGAYPRLVRSSGLLFVLHAALGSAARKWAAAAAPSSPSDAAKPPPARTVMTGAESPWGDGGQGAGPPDTSRRYLKYPLYLPSPPLTRWERLGVNLGFTIARCTVCGRLAPLHLEHANLRETAICGRCGSRTRQRQIAYVVCNSLSLARRRRLRSMREVAGLDSLVVYNTETEGAIHDVLSARPDYLCSEYLGPGLESGSTVDGLTHQDLMRLSYASDSIDLVLSSDVLEHVPDPYRAHAEVFRVLKRGGRHVFTVPFYQTEFLDEVRATVDADGAVVHHLEPVYHHDPVRPDEGVLVYTIFGVEMLAKLRRLGFRTHLYLLHSHRHGMLGPNGLVFEAIKE